MRAFEIKYKIISEIRLGSPYNLAEIEIIGDSQIAIENNSGWQDKHSWSRNGKFFAQVQWDLEYNNPGFRVILFDSEKGKIMQTNRISGCCNKLRLKNNLDIDYETFTQILKEGEKKEYGIIKGKIKLATTKPKLH